MNLRFVVLLFSSLVFSLVSGCNRNVEQIKSQDDNLSIKLSELSEIAHGTTKANWLQPPYKYWGIQNVDQLFDVGIISRAQQVAHLKKRPMDFSKLKIEQFDGKIYDFEEHLDSNRTDGFLILHKGDIVYEKYFNAMTPSTTHNWFSMSKSLTGLTLDILASEGKVDLTQSTIRYLPELKGSAWEGTTLQMVMDMLVGIQYSEKYNDPSSDAYKFAQVSELVKVPGPPSEFSSLTEYMASTKKGIDHDQLFHYVSLNTEVLGMVISKVTGKPPSKVMSEKIWSRIGTEQNAFIAKDPQGQELVSAVVNSNLRDAGRFGLLMLNDGRFKGEQIIPESVVTTVEKGGSVTKFADSKRGKQFKNFSYKNQWWHTDEEAYFAKGLFGQWIYIDPPTELVIVKFTTSDIPTSTEMDWINNMNLMREIVAKFEGETE